MSGYVSPPEGPGSSASLAADVVFRLTRDFERHALVRLGIIAQVDKFFTDLPVPAKAAKAFEKAGVEEIVAGAEQAA